jgi:hypothetical protein
VDLKSQVLSALLLLTGSTVPPAAPDKHPSFLWGVWECDFGEHILRLGLDADGMYVHWTLPFHGSDSAGNGQGGRWEFLQDSLVLMKETKYLMPGDGEDRAEAIKSLESQGHYTVAEMLARTQRAWVPVSDEEALVEAFRLQPWNGTRLSLRRWTMVDATEQSVAVKKMDFECHRQSLAVKPQIGSGT